VRGMKGTYPPVTDAQIDAASASAVAPFDPPAGVTVENPYTLHQELQQTMNDLVGIIRNAAEIQAALDKLETLKARARNVGVEGHRQFNPGWHLALDLRNMLVVSECIAKAALLRQESRGGHTRDDFPGMDPQWRQRNLVCSVSGDGVDVVEQAIPTMRDDLISLFEKSELKKYLSDEEVAALPEGVH